ncbi:MAG: tRNA pseudouridine(55) synthase TruB [Lachnospiraceae bacterium]|nr:tRNA pseudouridine(55) synthase TruB [Lachnospiraceae bacterium]
MINGIIVINKEAGFTSFDVVAKLRGILKQKKIGHTGTLDPDAVGVLPVCLGSATKLCDMLTDKKKEYIAEFVLGKTTDTQDISGKVLTESKVTCNEEQVRRAIAGFVGNIQQIPPMHSAIKVNGKRLYELARAGKEVERKPREITLYEIEVLSLQLPYVKMRVLCSKGTYIRTLCHDIGQKLDCGAVMTKLERTKSGEFTKEMALSLSQAEELSQNGKLEDYIIPVDRVFENTDIFDVPDRLLKKVLNGNAFSLRELPGQIRNKCREGENFRLYAKIEGKRKFLALYEYQSDKQALVPVKMFLD